MAEDSSSKNSTDPKKISGRNEALAATQELMPTTIRVTHAQTYDDLIDVARHTPMTAASEAQHFAEPQVDTQQIEYGLAKFLLDDRFIALIPAAHGFRARAQELKSHVPHHVISAQRVRRARLDTLQDMDSTGGATPTSVASNPTPEGFPIREPRRKNPDLAATRIINREDVSLPNQDIKNPKTE